MDKNQQFNYISYGAKVNADEITRLLEHMVAQLKGSNERVVPLCIWGMHGIGKTEMVKSFAEEKDCQFIYIAPAQFEEMGDLLGMPSIDKESQTTKIILPLWVPKEKGPGIFLIDDVNRADDRILRGIMQLLQNYELASWSFPEKWMILCTANPDGGDYSVTTMDDAMITRMIHVTMEYDIKAWARWAEKAEIDSRGISFVLTYPEIVNGAQTTPRSLVQFFQLIKDIPDLRKEIELVSLLAQGSVDKETAVAFTNFVHMDLAKIVAAEDILNTNDFKSIADRIDKLVNGKTKRLDILSVMMTRLTNHLLFMNDKLEEIQFNNLKEFMLLPVIPNDLRLSMAQDLFKADRADLKMLYAVPEIGKLILETL